MKILVKKMRSFAILRVQMVLGTIVMLAAMVVLPIGIICEDPTLILNPYVLGVIVIGMIVFGLFAYFLFIRPYLIYRKSPEVWAETDGENIYIYGKKQVSIPLSAFAGSVVTYHLPFIYSNEFISVLMTHMLSEKYGDLTLDVPGYGSYKMHFVSKVMETSDELITFLSNAEMPTDM